MRFFKSLFTFFAGAAVTGVTSAAAVNSKLVVRDSPFADLDLPASFWGTMDNYCRDGIQSKRDLSHLETRANLPDNYDNISPGNWISYFEAVNQHGAWTDFLVSCHGVVIVGDTTNPVGKSKYLAHFYATESMMDELWGTISTDVQKQGLTNMRAYLSLPDRSAPQTLDPADMLKVENKMIELLQGLTGSSPTVRYHDMKQASDRVGNIGTMQLNNADKTVLIDGNQV